MGGYGSGRSGGRATTESGLVLSLPKLISRRALSARMRMGRLDRLDEHDDWRAGRLDRLRGAPRRRNGAGPAQIHDNELSGRRTARVGLLGRAHDDATAFRGPAMVVRLPSNGPAGREPLLARRRLRLAPGIPARLSVAARNPLRPRLAPRLQAEGQAWGRWRDRRLRSEAAMDEDEDLRSEARGNLAGRGDRGQLPVSLPRKAQATSRTMKHGSTGDVAGRRQNIPPSQDLAHVSDERSYCAIQP